MTDRRQMAKRAAARAAADEVGRGARVGLGTGSTVIFALERLAERLGDGLDFVGVPTSEQTAARATLLGIPLTSLDAVDGLDLTIDGADEVDPKLDLIKGGGGALTREKIVAAASTRLVIVVDEDKLVPRLGSTFRLPIELLEFGSRATLRRIAALGLTPELRLDGDGRPFRTDSGQLIADAELPGDLELAQLEAELDRLPGVVECGLFLGMADRVYVGGANGDVRTLDA